MGADIEGFRNYLIKRGYKEDHVKRMLSLLARMLEEGGPDIVEEQTVSPWMRRKIRYVWRRYEEFLTYRRAITSDRV